MYDKQARREKYLRLKNGEKKHSCIEEEEAYNKIRWKWGFNDLQIKKLLKEYTVKEIFFGNYENGTFKPKNLIEIFLLILLVSSIFYGLNVLSEEYGIVCQKIEKDINDVYPK